LIQEHPCLLTTPDDEAREDGGVIDTGQGAHHWTERLTTIEYGTGLAMKVYPWLHGQAFVIYAWGNEHRVSCMRCREGLLN
jgi:hypothetical protein